MNIRLSVTAAAVAVAFPFAPAAAADESVAQPVIVSATRIDTPDVAAPYASEVHTRGDIERSGATTLVDYLARQTSLQVGPYFGNRFTPSIGMRGYGVEGHQNVVISLDGRRLNNIDLAPQLLGAIPLADIDRIEIAKGSGSVLYGDGATAGTVQIYTRARTGATIEGYAGSDGARGATAHAAITRERFSASATADYSAYDGYSHEDPSGHTDESRADSWRVALSGKPLAALELSLDAGRARIDTRYPGSLTLAQFRDDPSQNTGSDYTHQKFDTDYWSVGAKYAIAPAWRLSARHDDETKSSEFVQFAFESDYRYLSDELALQYLGDALSVTAGVQSFDGRREDFASDTSKRNLGWFVQGQYELAQLTLSAGARRERVDYEHDPDFGARIDDDERFTSWDLGANYRIDDALSVFGNLNRAFLAPDIDRFFVTDFFTGTTSFNGFISPAKARTLTLGVNHVVAANRLKLSVFHAELDDEIFFEPFTFRNTNIDESHKYGLELQDSWQITPALAGLLNYTWTRARIDRDDAAGGAFEGKELPGVPRHSVVVGLNLKVGGNGSLNLSQTWRSRAWAQDDFANDNVQRQRPYRSTDVAYRHHVKDLELYAAVANLFENENGVWVRDDAIYPVDFTRTWKVGAKFAF